MYSAVLLLVVAHCVHYLTNKCPHQVRTQYDCDTWTSLSPLTLQLHSDMDKFVSVRSAVVCQQSASCQINKPRAGLPHSTPRKRGNIRLPKVEQPKFKGHVT